MEFIGRTKELSDLEQEYNKNIPLLLYMVADVSEKLL